MSEAKKTVFKWICPSCGKQSNTLPLGKSQDIYWCQFCKKISRKMSNGVLLPRD